MPFLAMHTAATGLRALSTQLDVISNNLANANNNGFKSSRANFEDLFYQQLQQPGTQDSQGDERPTGLEIGLGTRVSGTQLDMSQGSAVQTNRNLDLYINGDGFFQVKVPPSQGDGLAYSRTGQLYENSNGALVLGSANGYPLEPAITLPNNAEDVNVTSDGRVFYTTPGSTTPQEAGQLQLARFVNPQGLTQIGGNLYQKSDASGAATLGNPTTDNFGALQMGFVEASNVDPVTELVNLIKTQRIFEFNSQSIQAADQMMQVIGSLRR